MVRCPLGQDRADHVIVRQHQPLRHEDAVQAQGGHPDVEAAGSGAVGEAVHQPLDPGRAGPPLVQVAHEDGRTRGAALHRMKDAGDLGIAFPRVESEMGDDLDEGGEGELMPSVAMLVVLCQHCDGPSPQVDQVRQWRERYLEIYGDQINDLASAPDFKVERRNVIVTTFNQLEELARKFWR